MTTLADITQKQLAFAQSGFKECIMGSLWDAPYPVSPFMMKYNPSNRYETQFTVPKEAIDINGHVNNVEYVRWMQDIAVEHAEVSGGTEATYAIGCTWVAREHRITYLTPCFEGDEIHAVTWVEAFGKVRSMRKYQFERLGDGKVVARGETDWVMIDVQSGRPKPITDKIRACFLL